MNFQNIEYFLAVVKYNNFTKEKKVASCVWENRLHLSFLSSKIRLHI